MKTIPKNAAKEILLKIKIKVVFEFAKEENAHNVAIALSSAGYFIRIAKGSIGFIVYVYQVV